MVLPFQQESIYGIYVYRFKTKNKTNTTPYQLTIDPTFEESKFTVDLVNLMNNNDNGLDDDIRQTVTHILSGFLVNIHREFYFSFQVNEKKDAKRFYKFMRWVSTSTSVKCDIKHLTIGGVQFVEFCVGLKD